MRAIGTTRCTQDDLRNALPHLSERDRTFGASLLKGWEKYGNLTYGQAPYADQLVERAAARTSDIAIANTTATVVATHTVGDMGGIMALFNKAKSHLKRPAIVLHVPCLDEVRITVAGATARFPGSLNVVSQSKFGGDGRRAWYGRVKLDGSYEPARSIDEDDAEAVAMRLREFSADPAGVASEHGKLTGRCCFCNLQLGKKDTGTGDQDAGNISTALGYGHTCAAHFGLVWSREAADAALAKTAAASGGAA